MASKKTPAVIYGQCPSETSSRCLTESFTTVHDFEVTDYTLLDGMGVGKRVRSSVFTVGGYDWTMLFFPDGWRKDCAGNASVFLLLLDPKEDVRAKLSINLLERHGQQVTNFGVMNRIFSTRSASSGMPKFTKKSILNSCFRIRCVLTVIKKTITEEKNLVAVPQPNLQVHLKHMLKDGEGVDVTFSVYGQLFNAHRCVLAARSPVFKAKLFGPMKDGVAESIEINDIVPLIFEALLHFVYTDTMPADFATGNTANLQHLLVAADLYRLDRLRVMCEIKLCETIDVATVATTLILAEQHHCTLLREACIGFMASRNVLAAVLGTDGFQHLVASFPLLMEEILRKVSVF